MNRTAAVGAGAALVATVVVGVPSLASAAPSTPAATATYSVVVSGLDNPKQLSYDWSARDLYVAESGHGGATCDESGLCSGQTGAISRIKRPDRVWNATPTRVVSGLLSFAYPDGTQASGPDGVAAAVSKLAVVTTGSPTGTTPGAAQLLRASRSTGYLKFAADLAAYENANDPDGTGPASDPTQVVLEGNRALVVDTAANDVVSVDAAGVVSTFAVVPSIFLEEDNITIAAQPTAIAQDGHGHVFVGDLGTGAGGGRITTFDTAGNQVAQITGFSGISGISVSPDGSLYVSEQGADVDESGVGGRLTKVATDGTRTGFDVPTPGGVAIGAWNQIYVVANSTSPAASATPGAVWRVNPSAFTPVA